MTVSTAYNGPQISLCDGSTTSFPVAFQYAAASELIVELIDAVTGDIVQLVEGADYTRSGDGMSAPTAITTLTTYPAGKSIQRRRSTPLTQTLLAPPNSLPQSALMERAWDRAILALQEVVSRVNVAIATIARTWQPPANSTYAGKYPVVGPNGELLYASGTGADTGLRTDLASQSGTSFVGWKRAKTGAIVRSVGDVLVDQASIMDFIVPQVERDKIRAGTSVADMSPYFAAAAAANIPIVFPAGSYHLGGSVLFNKRVTFLPGAKIYRDSGGAIGFAGGIDAPCEQIFYGFKYPELDINADLTPWGWVDWFGTDADALETAPSIFKEVRLAMHDYVVTRTVIWNHRFRKISGGWGSAEGTFGTRIVLTGAAAATQPVVQVGSGLTNGNVAADTARRLVVERINTYRDGVVQPAVTNRREDAVPGWEVKGWYEGRMVECFDFGSPIHYRVSGTCACVMEKCRGVRPYVGASNGHPDFYTAFAVGGYSTSWGFIGANASIRLIQCETAGGVGDTRVGLYLYGLMGDTWVEKFEMSQLEYGILIDGAAKGTSTALTAQDAHQDVMIQQPVLDACRTNCIRVQQINTGGQINISDVYAALSQPGAVVYIEDVKGAVSIDSGQILGDASKTITGIFATAAHMLHVSRSVKIKNCTIGIQAIGSDTLSIEASVVRTAAGGNAAVDLQNVTRSIIAPLQNGDTGTWTYGVTMDAACGYNSVDGTGIGFGSFVSMTAANKVRFNGGDARTAFGSNLLTGNPA
ncbi:hypothetical protein [Sphingomonas trueperi]|uniref:Pectate lyase-like protein n=1 Tax=Sphingomonas trueperi TaxID=53317 RepID=A0A7X5Y5P5_9SPHN|nr:hypothetical protein [Sphingomonas trueperi]NJB99861.1 hypothetical protein [Sphingomonas trueperi]